MRRSNLNVIQGRRRPLAKVAPIRALQFVDHPTYEEVMRRLCRVMRSQQRRSARHLRCGHTPPGAAVLAVRRVVLSRPWDTT